MKKKVSLVVFAILAVLLCGIVAGCGGKSEQEVAHKHMEEKADARVPFEPTHEVEFHNYNKAQELYDSPETIIWCSVMPQASTAPIITVPIAGKLTSSTTTFYPPEKTVDPNGDGNAVVAERSVDGMFHPNPPKYRYGFTPGGQYVDFFELPTFCTTAPMSFQKESVSVTVDKPLNTATEEAEEALAKGEEAKAQQILEGAVE